MLNKISQSALAAICIALVPAAVSCVDHDYDLSKDMDLNVTIAAGELTIPMSSTDIITLNQILDLESSSSIRTVDYDGEYGLALNDYLLEQSADPTHSNIHINQVDISDLHGNTFTTELPEFINAGGEKITVESSTHFNAVDLNEDDVTDELLSLDEATTAIDLVYTIGYISSNFSGTAFIDKGFTATFDPSWTVEVVDPATKAFIESVNDNTIRFTKDMAVGLNSSIDLKLRVAKIDFTKVPAGQGLYEVGHFRLNTSVNASGYVSILGTDIAVGSTANLELFTTTDVISARILSIKGRVNPHINIDPTTFNITDVPDFLSNNRNNLDIDNPMIFVDVKNDAPLTLEFNALAKSNLQGAYTVTVGLGKQYGTDPIMVEASKVTRFCISRRPVSFKGVTNIVCENLGELISTVPESIDIEQVSATVPSDEVCQISLGTSYDCDTEYEVIVPLSFGPDMKLFYTHEDKGWNEDLGKYNFDKVLITADAINTIPLNLTPRVKALNHMGEEISDITAEIFGDIEAGTLANPSTAHIEITLSSTAENMANLDGIRLEFDAFSGPATQGVNLNSEQNLSFDNIKISILGGITVDLND